MALYSLRLRRALTISSSIFTQTFNKPAVISSIPNNSSGVQRSDFIPYESRRLFRSSTISLSSRYRSFDNRNPGNGDDDAIGPDTILFEGCDYEHWLIVIDFPKDTQLTREEMIDTYVQTAAQVFGSVEEAKKKIYALSTTTYRGFQVLCSEEVSKKFEGLPGVVFVLPDSYVDPVNKEYGGDKYINGEIIERPPPPQFQRQRPPRRGPSNYGPPQQNYGAPRGPPPQQNYGAPQGHPSGQNYGAPQGPASQQNYGAPQGHPTQQQYYGAPQGPPPQQNYGAPQGPPPKQNYGASQGPPSQQSYSQPRYPPPQQNYGQQQYTPPPQQNYSPPQTPPQQNYGQPQNPPAQGYVAPQDLPSQWNHGPQQTFSPQQSHEVQGAGDRKGPTPLGSSLGGWDNSRGDRQDSRPPYRVNYTQGEQENYFPRRDQRGHAPPEQSGFRGDNQHYAPPQGGNYGEGPIGGQVQGTGPTFGHNNPRQGEDQRYPQMEQRGQGRY